MHECLKKRKLFSLERLDNILGGENFSYQHFTLARREGENERKLKMELYLSIPSTLICH